MGHALLIIEAHDHTQTHHTRYELLGSRYPLFIKLRLGPKRHTVYRKGKVVFVQGKEGIEESGGEVPLILNLGAIWYGKANMYQEANLFIVYLMTLRVFRLIESIN
jgi:hypothetical protein